MALKNFLFTSESVTEGHPDKVCDQISDAILDEFLTKDPKSRVAAETTVTTGMALVCGEITSNCYVDIPSVVRNTIKSIGYNGEEGGGFDYKTCAVLTSIDEQSSDIAGGVNKALETRNDNADTSKRLTLVRAIKVLCLATLAMKHPNLCLCLFHLHTDWLFNSQK